MPPDEHCVSSTELEPWLPKQILYLFYIHESLPKAGLNSASANLFDGVSNITFERTTVSIQIYI